MQFVKIISIVATVLFLSSCTQQDKSARPNGVVEGESFPISTGKMKNCRFKNPNPTYAFSAKIEPNPILCDEGLPKHVEKLSPASLPTGINFEMGTLSLEGIANERVSQAPFEFYLENESGYSIIKIQISIQ